MQKTLAPTKGNLMTAKNTLRLSKQGYEMLDKKRNILIREMMNLIEEAKEVEARIEETFAAAYKALESANIIMGVSKVQEIAHSVVFENSVKVDLRSVMGVEIPVVKIRRADDRPAYSFYSTSSALDLGLAQGDEILLLGDLLLLGVQQLILQADHRVVVTDGALDKALGILGAAGGDHFQAGEVAEQRLQGLGVMAVKHVLNK